MKIYVASSWRNAVQPKVVEILRACGHEVYDFRHPEPGNFGFSWRQVALHWTPGEPVDAHELVRAYEHPIAKAGWLLDMQALMGCDAVVYVLPCGRSASWEFGYAMGQGKDAYVVQLAPEEPELMFMGARFVTTLSELREVFFYRNVVGDAGPL